MSTYATYVKYHCPLPLQVHNSWYDYWKGRFFRYQNFWNDYEDVTSIVQNCWFDVVDLHSSFDCFHQDLRRVRRELSFWNKHKIGRIEENLSNTYDEILSLEKDVGEHNLELSEEYETYSWVWEHIYIFNVHLEKGTWVNVQLWDALCVW